MTNEPEIQISIRPVPLDVVLTGDFRRKAIALEAKYRAALDLYSALKMCLATGDMGPEGVAGKAALAAIAKAEGECK